MRSSDSAESGNKATLASSSGSGKSKLAVSSILGVLVSGMMNPQALVLALVSFLMFGTFIFDIATPPDDVSICFVYAVLISVSIFSFRRAAYLCAVLATALSWTGAFIQTPNDTLVFFANRAIAVTAQWLVAFLVTTRKDAEALMRAENEAERKKAETSHRFIDVLSHEIGTSLTLIDGQAFRLKRLAQNNELESVTGRADKIRQAVSHIEAVIRQVQVASEVEQGKMYFRPVVFDLRQLVANAVLQVEPERMIQTDLAELPAAVRGDSDMLQQVVANLLSNAIKYSSVGTTVAVRGRTEQNLAVLSISDQGRGIPEDEKSKLFEPYYRATNSRGVHGVGIGLYVVDRYIASHGGSIRIDSVLGLGTTVTISIPIGQM